MELFLFSFDFKLAITLYFLFTFISPLFLFFIKKRKIWIFIYSITYILLLCIGVFTNIKSNYSSISFSLLITNKWADNSLNIAYFDFISTLINLFLLFPLGIIIPFIINKNINFYKIIGLGLLTSIIIEFFQFLLPIIRYPELLDILTNTISVILGYLYYLIIEKVLNRSDICDKLPKQKSNNSSKKRIC